MKIIKLWLTLGFFLLIFPIIAILLHISTMFIPTYICVFLIYLIITVLYLIWGNDCEDD